MATPTGAATPTGQDAQPRPPTTPAVTQPQGSLSSSRTLTASSCRCAGQKFDRTLVSTLSIVAGSEAS